MIVYRQMEEYRIRQGVERLSTKCVCNDKGNPNYRRVWKVCNVEVWKK